jgi:hypothetical protein
MMSRSDLSELKGRNSRILLSIYLLPATHRVFVSSAYTNIVTTYSAHKKFPQDH